MIIHIHSYTFFMIVRTFFYDDFRSFLYEQENVTGRDGKIKHELFSFSIQNKCYKS